MKKDSFKLLIKEFHEDQLPSPVERELILPRTKKIITLTGSRRSGKTFYFFQLIQTLLQEVDRELIIYLNFEDDRILPLEISDLDTLLEAYYELYPHNKDKELFLFFDEIQNVDSWEVYIRRIHDKEKVKIWITGSNSNLLSREIATSLRGRTLTFSIFPFSFREFLTYKGIQKNHHLTYSKDRFKVKKLFDRYLRLGGFPEVVTEENHLEQSILSEYFEIMIYRDIVERFSVRNTNLLKKLGKYLLTNIARPFSINGYYSSLKETTAVSKETLFEYVSYFQEASVIYLVPLFSYSVRKQQMNPKKVYCVDNGLRNAVSFTFSQDYGWLAENLVFIELQKQGVELYYWKDKEEVDFVVKHKDHSITAINVTYDNEIKERELSALAEFKGKHRKVKKLLLLTKDRNENKGSVQCIPLWEWLLHPKI